jgi:NADPH2:quinone reductase
MQAVRVHKPGDPEGLVYEDVPEPKAGVGQALVKVEAIGLNFAEVKRRRVSAGRRSQSAGGA